MKMKRILTILLVIVMLFASTIPYYISANDIYNTTVPANQGSFKTAGSNWGAADLYRNTTCYRITPSSQATFVYNVINATKFIVFAAQHNGLPQLLSFEVSTDGTNYTSVDMTINTIASYTAGNNWPINEQEYVSPSFTTPNTSIRITKAECYVEWYFAMVNIKYQSLGVDKTSLQTLIDSTNTFDETNYTPVSWSPFINALGNAILVNNDSGSTQTQVNNTLTDLQNAIDNLEFEPTMLEESFSVVSQYNATMQGPFWYYVSTQDNSEFSLLSFPNIASSANVNWWSRTESITWGSASLIRLLDGNIMMYRDGMSFCPAIAFKAPKQGYVNLAYYNELFDVYKGVNLNDASVIEDSFAAISVNKDDFIIFALKSGKFSVNEFNAGNPTVNYVERIPLTSITLNKDSLSLIKNNSDTLSIATFMPNDTNDSKKVSWSSDNENAAIVSSTGLVTAVSAGFAKISAKVGTNIAICDVTVTAPLESISIKSSTVIGLGDTETLIVTYNPTDTTDDKTVVWTSSDEEIATVLPDGSITAKSIGSSIITARVGTITSTCSVQVVIPLLSVTISDNVKIITKGDSFQLALYKIPTTTTMLDNIIWASTNLSIASVDENGLVTAVGSGQATITATISGKSATCIITVKSPLINVSLNKSTIHLVKEFTDLLTVNFNPFDTTDSKAITWTTSNDKVAGVSGGVVTGTGIGTATITATIGNQTVSCAVSVVAATDNGNLSLSPSNSPPLIFNEITTSTSNPKNGDPLETIPVLVIMILSVLILSLLLMKIKFKFKFN